MQQTGQEYLRPWEDRPHQWTQKHLQLIQRRGQTPDDLDQQAEP